ncbi:MAG: OmpA family protein [Paludibacter sp.]|nr:OmpA family protein [Paludibacter sp.]
MNKMFELTLCLAILVSTGIKAQSWLEKVGNRVKDKAVEKVEERIETKSEEAVDKTLDKLETSVSKNNKKDSASTTEKNKKNIKTEPNKSFIANTKYDFVPGDKILYFDDFSQDAIGDFPALWSTDGGGEVKTLNIASGHWFHLNKEGCFYCYTKTIDFPQNFIMEFDFIPDENFQGEVALCLYEEKESMEMNSELYPGVKGIQIFMNQDSWWTKGYYNSEGTDSPWLEAHSTANPPEINKVNHVIIWIQNRRIRIYHKGAKVLDAPTNIYSGAKFNKIRFDNYNSQCNPYISNLKVTTAAPDTRSKLITEGKLVSYGIYFDVNKDVVKTESYGTISDIAKVLKENPTVNIKIVGHTDSDGNDPQNLDLSKRRAASVKTVLTSEFGIDGSRIQTDGKGETEPIAPNTTSENKAKNRRVEFIKL